MFLANWLKKPIKIPLPLPNTYWVVPTRLLAGEHPFGLDDADARSRVARLCDAGVDCFVDLTEEGECGDYRRFLPEHVVHVRCAILDTCVPEDPAQMRELQATLRKSLTLGRCVYVHCRAGIGRTGMAIGCYLVDEGLTGKRALKLLNQLWRQSARAKSWPRVPQTREQADYVEHWENLRISALSQRVDS